MNLHDSVLAVLGDIPDPNSSYPLSQVARLESVREEGDLCCISLQLGYPMETERESLHTWLEAHLNSRLKRDVRLELGWSVVPNAGTASNPALQNVKHIIAVASGKGGVGKSTTAVNLALALKKLGASVGILDADIYGPSQAMMLGIPAGTRPGTENEQYMLPVKAMGIQSMSMAYLVDEETPMAWRGPMVSSALQQMLLQTRWEPMDYMIVDMPPGTGDIQLTFSQKVPATGAVIVTTPQDIALLDARKGIELFTKVNIPVLGVLENMAVHVCSQCGHEEHIFGENGGKELVEKYQTRLLASMPLSLAIRENSDNGQPVVESAPESNEAKKYLAAAMAMTAEIAMMQSESATLPDIMVSDD